MFNVSDGAPRHAIIVRRECPLELAESALREHASIARDRILRLFTAERQDYGGIEQSGNYTVSIAKFIENTQLMWREPQSWRLTLKSPKP